MKSPAPRNPGGPKSTAVVGACRVVTWGNCTSYEDEPLRSNSRQSVSGSPVMPMPAPNSSSHAALAARRCSWKVAASKPSWPSVRPVSRSTSLMGRESYMGSGRMAGCRTA